jgi:hypothetical protein
VGFHVRVEAWWGIYESEGKRLNLILKDSGKAMSDISLMTDF